jgi:predicted TIM-barrel fold metal-dependent hydrolase
MNARHTLVEPILEPDLPIVDPHHHLWLIPEAALAVGNHDSVMSAGMASTMRAYARYLFDDLMADITAGHNIRATVFVEAHAMYKTTGPEELRSLGEVEYVNGVAAMGASGLFGDIKVCAGIVGSIDLRLGDRAKDILLAHVAAGGGRYRGIRPPGIAFDEDKSILGFANNAPGALANSQFRAGFKHLAPLGLSCDVWMMHPQIPDLIDLARAFPETQIILDHVGTPLNVGRHAGRAQERFDAWRQNVRALAQCPNVAMKLGGLGMPISGLASVTAAAPASSEQLAREWAPYMETCIEVFGVDRCMFESNFPPDACATPYPIVWNAFKRIAAKASPTEKQALFSGTAKRIYKLDF